MSWHAAAENGSPISYYLVTAYNGSTPQNAVATDVSTTSAALTGLVAGTTYTFKVTAHSECGATSSATTNAVTPTGASTTYASTVLADGPSAYFRLNELTGPVAADSSGQALTAYYNRDLEFGGHDVLGLPENPLVSDPSNTSVDFVDANNCCYHDGLVDPSSAGLPAAGQPVTSEFWFKDDGNGALEAVNLMSDLEVAVPTHALNVTANGLTFATPYPVSDGGWHMLDVVNDGVNSVTVYLDGQSIGTKSGSGATAAATGLEVGRQGRGPLDEVAIYSKALSATQVAAHFAASGDTRPRAAAEVTATPGPNQLAVTWPASTAAVPETGSQVTYYGVHASRPDGTVVDAMNVPGSSTSATLSDLAGGTAYTIHVIPHNQFGAGPEQASAPVTPSGAPATYASTVLADEPAAYFQLNDLSGPAAADSSGHELTAYYNYENAFGGHNVLGSTENPLISDPLNTSVNFVDANNCCYSEAIVDPISKGLPAAGQPVTAEFWFKENANWNTPIEALNLIGDLHVEFSNQVNIVANGLNFPTPYPISDNAWHMLDVVDDGVNSIAVYLDGQLIGSQSGSGPTAAATGLEIGRVGRGAMGQVAIYTKAPSGSAVAGRFAASGQAGPPSPPPGMSVIFGTVFINGGGTAQGARVQACHTSGASCIVDPNATDSLGWYHMLVPNGTYAVTIFPPPSSPSGPHTIGPVTLPPSPAAVTTTLIPQGGLPEGGTLASPSFGTQESVVPRVGAGEPLTLTVPGCKGGFGAVNIQGSNWFTGQPESQPTPLAETPPESGSYVAHIAPVIPIHGSASASHWIVCPKHTRVLPSGGSSAGGTSVLVAGSGFTGATSVTFGSAAALSFTVLRDNVIEAVSPPGTGEMPVSVTTAQGQTVTVGNFSHVDVTGLSPTSGEATGGTHVTIHGDGFSSTASVIFGLVAASSVTVVSPTEIRAVAPPGFGTVDVQVVEGEGGSRKVASDVFTYENVPGGSPPVNESSAPSPEVYAQQVNAACTVSTIAGDLQAAPELAQFPQVCEGAAVIFHTVALDAVNNVFETEVLDAFLGSGVYGELVEALPVLGAIIPEAIPVVLAGLAVYEVWQLFVDPSGTIVDMRGNAIGGATATLLGQPAPGAPFSPVPPSSAAIEPATNPETTGQSGQFHWDALAGTYEVQASAPGCHRPGDASEANVFTTPFVIPPPAVGLTLTLECPGSTPPTPIVTGVAPASGPTAGGNTVDILGEGLAGTTAVQFGSTPAAFIKVLSPYAIAAVAPAGISTAAVTVTTQGGTSKPGEASAYSYVAPIVTPESPVVSAVTPGNGPVSGGTVVTINGRNLAGAFAVNFGSVSAAQVTDVSSTEVQAVAPAPPFPLRVDVSVTTSVGTSAPALADGFVYGSPPPPVATSVTLTPPPNPVTVGQPVTLTAGVAPTDGGGTVGFYADGSSTPLSGCGAQTLTLSGGSYRASCTTSTLTTGSHALSASYSGDPSYAASSGSASLSIVQAPGANQPPGGGSGDAGGAGAAGGGEQKVLNNRTAKPSTAQITALLASELTPAGKAAKIAMVRKHGGFALTIKAMEGGTVVIDWYQVPAGARLAKKARPKPVLVAFGRLMFTAAGTAIMRIKLTAAGKRALTHAPRLKLTAKGTFTPTSEPPISVLRPFVLKR